MGPIYRREMKAYFQTPSGYVFIFTFLFISGLFFSLFNILSNSSNLNQTLQSVWFLLLFIFMVPILTMRLLSDERKAKTDQLLLTSPLSLWSIVIGKFLAACTMLIITLGLTGTYVLILSIISEPAMTEVLVTYLGFFLMGCCFIAVGTLLSAISENQVTTYVTTVGTLLAIFLLNFVIPYLNVPVVPEVLGWLSMFKRYDDLAMGVLGLSSVVYMISFCALFIFFAVRSIDRRRWI